MKVYKVRRVSNPHCIRKASILSVNEYPWYSKGVKKETQVQIAYSTKYLILKVVCEDSDIYGKRRILNSDVYRDSCFEFFFSPSGIKGAPYFNLEINCTGVMYFSYGPDVLNRQECSEEESKKILIETSIKSKVKVESLKDQKWTLDVMIPFSLIEGMSDLKMDTQKWFANFYRIGGRKSHQYACWNPIHNQTPNFHKPDDFGTLVFERS